MTPHSVYIMGFYGAGNFGDEAILYTVLDSLEETYDSPEVVVESSDPALTSSQHDVEAVPRFSEDPRGVVSAIRTADELVVGGGTLIKPYFYLRISLLSIIGKLTGTEITWFSVGVEPPKSLADRRMYGALSSVTDRITVRDQYSKRELAKEGASGVTVVPDPVFNTDPLPLKDYSSPDSYIAVVVREYASNPLDTDALAEAMDQLSTESDARIMFVSYRDRTEDARVIENVRDAMSHESTVYDGDFSLGELHSLTANADLVIGMRLHSIVVAAASEVPFVTLSYKPKCNRVANQIGDTTVYDCGTFDPNNLAETANSRLQKDGDLLRNIDDLRNGAGTVWDHSVAPTNSIENLVALTILTGVATGTYVRDRRWPLN